MVSFLVSLDFISCLGSYFFMLSLVWISHRRNFVTAGWGSYFTPRHSAVRTTERTLISIEDLDSKYRWEDLKA